MKKYVENIMKYIQNMKEYVENKKKYEEQLEDFLGEPKNKDHVLVIRVDKLRQIFFFFFSKFIYPKRRTLNSENSDKFFKTQCTTYTIGRIALSALSIKLSSSKSKRRINFEKINK